jgi:long-chain acyl-CoA synthetase
MANLSLNLTETAAMSRGQDGEIQIRAHNVMQGYWRLPEAAAVVRKRGATATAPESTGFVKKRIAAHTYPRQVWFVDDLPKGTTGKMSQRKVRAPRTETAS